MVCIVGRMTNTRHPLVLIADLRVYDTVSPLSAADNGKTFTVVDLHTDKRDGRYVTAAVTLTDGWHEHVDRTPVFALIDRYSDNDDDA